MMVVNIFARHQRSISICLQQAGADSVRFLGACTAHARCHPQVDVRYSTTTPSYYSSAMKWLVGVTVLDGANPNLDGLGLRCIGKQLAAGTRWSMVPNLSRALSQINRASDTSASAPGLCS